MMSIILNARELARFLVENHKCDFLQVPTTVDEAVLEYINTNWVARGYSDRLFTEEQCLEKFNAELPDVQCAFQKLGFMAHFSPKVTSGFLWWKRVIPAYLHVFIPDDYMQSIEED